MTINVNGKQEEAYHLIMRKENALDIVNGSKHVEIRDTTDTYCSRFFNKELWQRFLHLLEMYNKNQDEEVLDEALTEMGLEVDADNFWLSALNQLFNDVKYIYFTNYNKSWHLVVEISGKKVYELTEETRKLMNEKYRFYDFNDEDISEYQDEDGNAWEFFALELGEIIEHKGLVD